MEQESFSYNEQSHNRHSNLSAEIYGLKWENAFPYRIEEHDITISIGTFEQAEQFYSRHYTGIYHSHRSNPFLSSSGSVSRQRYYKTSGDFFIFKHQNEIIGLFVGTPVDWSTYFFRNCSILPEFQGKGLYQILLNHLIETLKATGVERIEGDVAPSNLRHIHILNKMGFHITGFRTSERWGALLQFTKFLTERHKAVFLSQFCHGD